MLNFLHITALVCSIFPLIEMTKIKRFYCIIPVALIFDFAMVIPCLLEMFMGPPTTVYYNFRNAMMDEKTNLIFYLFIIIAQVCFYFEIRRIKWKNKKSMNYNISQPSRIYNKIVNSRYRKQVIGLCYLVMLLSIIAVLLAPDPTYYLKLHSVYSTMSQTVYNYDKNIISIIQNLLLIAIVLLKIYDDQDSRIFFVTRILCTIGVALLNQKRTTVMLILGFCLVIDIAFKNKNLKKTMIKYIPAIILVAIYFWAYALITEKISYNQDWYYVINEYFFRNIHTKFSIYAELYPNKVHILDYPCQAILCDFLFFIPRSLWLAKPHNYPYYFIAGLLNYGNITEKTWIMPTSYYPEFVSNFGIIGLLISIFFTIFICRYLDKKDSFIKMGGIAIISVLQIYYYDDMLKILAMIVLAMIILQKCSFNGKRIL